MKVRNVPLLNGHTQGGGILVDAKALRIEQAAAADRQQPFGRAEGRLHQDLGHVARLVALLVGNQGHGLLLYLARWRALAAAHPAGELALVLPAKGIGDRCRDLVLAAHCSLKGAGHRLLGRAHGAGLDVSRFLAPAAAQVLPLQPGGLDLHRAVGHRHAVQVGDNELDLEGLAALDKGALAAQANVELGRVHQQGRGSRPGLAVHVHHRGLGQHALRLGLVRLVEFQAQVVIARGIGQPGKGLSINLLGVGPVGLLEIERFVGEPPGRPPAKDEIRPVGRRVAAGRGADLPGHLRVGQRAAGVVAGLDGHGGLSAGKVGPGGLVARRDLKLGAAELLHLEPVAITIADHTCQAADRLQLDPRLAQIGICG